MQVLVHLHSVFLDHCFSSRVIAFGSDALNLAEQLAIQTTNALVIIDLEVVFAIAFDNLYLFVLSVLIYPKGNQLTVAHVRFLDVFAWLDTHELGHETIHHLLVVEALVCLFILQQTELYQLRVSHIVETEQVGTCLLDSRSVLLERIFGNAWHEFARTVTYALVEVGMQVATSTCFFVHSNHLWANHKLLVEAIAFGCFVVGVGDIVDSNRLRTIVFANPVSIRQVDADWGSWIAVACQDSSGDNLCAHAFDFLFLVFLIGWGVVLEPLCVVGDGLATVGSTHVFEVHE